MEKLSVVESIIEVVSFSFGHHQMVCAQAHAQEGNFIRARAEVKKSLEMPPEANNPAIREAMR